MFYDDEILDNFELWELYEDSLVEKQDKEDLKVIFNIINRLNFRHYCNEKESIRLCFQPIIKEKNSLVEAEFIYTSKDDMEKTGRLFKLEMFTNGRTILTSQGAAPEIILSVVKEITHNYGKFPEDEISEVSIYFRSSFQEIF